MIPDRKGDRWFEKKAVIEALATVPPVLAAAIGALTSLSDPQKQVFGVWLAAGTVWLAGAGVARVLHAQAQDHERRRADDYEGLRAALQVLFAVVCDATGLSYEERTSGKLRLTLHRVVSRGRDRAPDELEQMLPYLGVPGSRAGRRFSIRSGIIGKAVRQKSAVTATRSVADPEGFVAELVGAWSYTEPEARRLSADRFAWMAVPVIGPSGAPVAVVYLDSTDATLFNDLVQDVVLAGCRGITTYTREAYP